MKRLVITILVVFFLQACVGPRYHAKVGEFVDFSQAYDTLSLHQAPSFWLQHAELDSLVILAFDRNPDILTAWARVRQARASAGLATSALFPSISATGSASRAKTTITSQGIGTNQQQQQPANPQLPTSGGAGSASEQTVHANQFQGSIAASYEVDLWGKLFRKRHAAVLEAQAAEADARAMSITLAARVIDTWLMLVAQRQTVDLLENQLETSRRFEELTRLRFSQGLSSAVDLAQQKQQVETVTGRLVLARARVKTLQHQIAVMLGHVPTYQAGFSTRVLPEPPELDISGVPRDLFSHRPDVRSAWHRLRAADARAAAAVLEFLPSLRLSANLFSNAREIAELFEDWLWTISANLSQPVFQGGRLFSAKKQANATAEAQYYSYINTALTALREVRDGLVGIRSQEAYLRSLQDQVVAAENVLNLSRERYAQGALPYLQVLTALQSLHQAQQNLIESHRQLLSNHVQLYRALGGSFENADARAGVRKEGIGG